MIKSIVGRLTTWYATSLFLLLFGAVLLTYFSLSKILDSEDSDLLKDRIEAINNLVKSSNDPIAALKQRVESEWASRRFEHVYVKILNEKNEILVATPQLPAELNQDLFATIERDNLYENSKIQKSATTSGNVYLVFTSLLSPRSTPAAKLKLIAALDLNFEKDVLSSYRKTLLALLAFGLVVSVAIGAFLARFLFSPVQDIINKAREIRSTSLHQRLEEHALPSELQVLASTVNDMLGHLEDAFSRLSQFSSNLAHEIRTPINNIRGEIEVALSQDGLPKESSELLLSVNEDIVRISSLVDNLLFIAKSESPGNQLVRQQINLHDEIANIVDFYEAATSEKEILVEMTINKSMYVNAEKTLFQRAVNNILANSINYTNVRGKIRASAKLTAVATNVIIEDTGSGISAEDLPKVFDRFFRADAARTSNKLGGFGLGLTIVKSIMKLHGGTVSIESRNGEGTRVTLVFPNQ
jgi:two-component system, OmpR family, heavy metal sensor histidine kinase CusS